MVLTAGEEDITILRRTTGPTRPWGPSPPSTPARRSRCPWLTAANCGEALLGGPPGGLRAQRLHPPVRHGGGPQRRPGAAHRRSHHHRGGGHLLHRRRRAAAPPADPPPGKPLHRPDPPAGAGERPAADLLDQIAAQEGEIALCRDQRDRWSGGRRSWRSSLPATTRRTAPGDPGGPECPGGLGAGPRAGPPRRPLKSGTCRSAPSWRLSGGRCPPWSRWPSRSGTRRRAGRPPPQRPCPGRGGPRRPSPGGPHPGGGRRPAPGGRPQAPAIPREGWPDPGPQRRCRCGGHDAGRRRALGPRSRRRGLRPGPAAVTLPVRRRQAAWDRQQEERNRSASRSCPPTLYYTSRPPRPGMPGGTPRPPGDSLSAGLSDNLACCMTQVRAFQPQAADIEDALTAVTGALARRRAAEEASVKPNPPPALGAAPGGRR